MKQFTASISHELCTPLTALRGEADFMLLQPNSVQEYQRLLASHLEEYDRLARLVNRPLTLARAEAGEGRIDVKSEPGKDSCFTILLPAAPYPGSASAAGVGNG